MKRLTLRYAFFILGVAINSFGVAFITKSALGTSQISSVPYVLSLQFSGLSFGMCTFLFNMLFILVQIVLLKREFRPIQFLQIAVNVLFSSLIDVSMAVLWFFQPETLPVRLVSLLVGCAILAVGINQHRGGAGYPGGAGRGDRAGHFSGERKAVWNNQGLF